jgi:hypothetical protein
MLAGPANPHFVAELLLIQLQEARQHDAVFAIENRFPGLAPRAGIDVEDSRRPLGSTSRVPGASEVIAHLQCPVLEKGVDHWARMESPG